MGRVIGIDLGTTNSVVAFHEGGETKVIPTQDTVGNLTPSVVAINPKTGERLIGEVARNQAAKNPENTVLSAKRFMGREFRNAKIGDTSKLTPYKLTEAPNGDIHIIMNGKDYSPQEISAFILQKVKADAEDYLGEEVTQAVITVPAFLMTASAMPPKRLGASPV